ncbi:MULTISPECIES: helix-turn-helix domain-containing protein [Bacillus]|uniref:helix-turn-helix domain-containing protein n=1 Tax=Bacillus TaxID=1386 RepID=UPI0004627D35|nr:MULTISPECIES: helix-turn-helix transcriptional regulator [Bacillus]ATH73156.1 XRE family transcriptional regulator [Bacillus altitudinis]UYO34677.1 helix-turn-helix transcriptional regulator [Bacillus zhangzhouensis]
MFDRKSLFKIRKIFRLTQEDVAKITRTSPATVSRIESGEQELSEGFSECILSALKLTETTVKPMLEFYDKTERVKRGEWVPNDDLISGSARNEPSKANTPVLGWLDKYTR